MSYLQLKSPDFSSQKPMKTREEKAPL